MQKTDHLSKNNVDSMIDDLSVPANNNKENNVDVLAKESDEDKMDSNCSTDSGIESDGWEPENKNT